MARTGGNSHEAQKNATKMAAKAAELKRGKGGGAQEGEAHLAADLAPHSPRTRPPLASRLPASP
eukprot:scaffold111017_cov48-Phaeocystis_antarctica.AAC.2